MEVCLIAMPTSHRLLGINFKHGHQGSGHLDEDVTNGWRLLHDPASIVYVLDYLASYSDSLQVDARPFET
jgi:hypothetical protein